MVLGGVATGNINAMAPDKVAGSVKINGFVCVLTAILARIGKIISVAAEFEVSSGREVIKISIMKMTRMGL